MAVFKEEAMTHGQRNNFDALRLFSAFLVLISHQFALSGRAEPRFVGDHPPRHLTNGSLWTFPYEVYCYGLLLVAGVATRRPSIVLAVGVFGYFVLSGLQSGESFLADFGLFFAAGSLLRACPYLRKPLPTLSSLVIGYALIRIDQTNLGLAFVVPSLTIAIGVRSWAGLRNISKVGDLSYGIYIYAWPVQQIGVALWGRETPYLELLSITVPVTVALAAASWHIVEKKALRFKPGRPFGNSAPGRAQIGRAHV